uniref:a primordial catalytic fold generated by in vitro evolution n=1 Tax=synthetic construct TaxID=32630 RepID=UPI000290CF2E|nr:Chain A, a primordial catalytic fold generated by in vitro evolution [synthetic construct]
MGAPVPYPDPLEPRGGKHICAICGNNAEDYKHTDMDLTYTDRDYKNCESYHKCSDLCQYCRYQKDLAIHHQHHHGGSMGMSGSGTGY